MERKRSYDVIVVGGGAAGLAAAIGAKRAGSSVLLIERNGSLGGQVTNANVASYCGFYTHGENPEQIVKGIGQELLAKLDELGFGNGYRLSPTGNSIFTLDIEATKLAFDQLVQENDVDCLLRCQVTEARVDEEGNITSIVCADDEGYCEFEGKSFIDATGDANLGFLAKAEYRYGDGEGGSYPTTRVMRLDRVSTDAKFAPALIREAVTKAKADGLTHLTKDAGIIFRTNEDTVAAILPSCDVPALDAETLTKCEMDTRRQSFDYLEAFRRYLPGFENARLVWTGNLLGTRDTRHLICEKQLTKDNVINGEHCDDGIACGAWPCEMHTKDAMLTYIYVKDDGYYQIPLGALKVKSVRNLWAAGRTVDADHVAFASVRVMGIGFATGHAAGVAAAISSQNEQYTVEQVQEELKRQGAFLG